MKKNRAKYDDDDGRTIASMNVDGMPWHAPRAEKVSSGERQGPGIKLQGAERRAFAWGVLKAILLVSAIFIVAYLLFILFCTKVWFA